MPDEQDEDEDDNQHWEDEDYAQWNGNCRVAAQPQWPLEERQSRCQPLVFLSFFIRGRKPMRVCRRAFRSPEDVHGD
jgi:hypothetical protein